MLTWKITFGIEDGDRDTGYQNRPPMSEFQAVEEILQAEKVQRVCGVCGSSNIHRFYEDGDPEFCRDCGSRDMRTVIDANLSEWPGSF